MLPARNNKIDLSKLTDEERKIFKLYGKLPTGKDILTHKLKERKYFDSGDYALSKAGKAQGPVGSQHPSPETVPHANAIASQTHNSSPVKESSLVHETPAVPTPVPAAPAVSGSSSAPAPALAPALAPAPAPASGPAPGTAPAPVTTSVVPAVTAPVSGSSEATTPASDATEVTTSTSAPGASGASADPPDDANVAPVASPVPAIKSQ